jgi:hypothetical protein
VVRSYQRVFRPARRIYQVQGHRLPVPGGVPLRWLGYGAASLVAVLLLSSGSRALAMVLVIAAAVTGRRVGGWRGAAVGAWAVAVASHLSGWVLESLDWPLRLIVVPALAATVATQATPDGRSSHRFALSWLRLWWSPSRSSLGRQLAHSSRAVRLGGPVSAWADEHGQVLRRCRVRGAARVSFSAPLVVRRRGWPRRQRLVATPYLGRASGADPVARVELAAGEVLEVRP